MNPNDVYRLPRLELTKVILLAVVQAVTLGAFLLLARALFDAMAAGAVQHERVFTMIWWLLGVVLLNALARGVEFYVSERMGYEVVRGLRMTMYRHLQGMSPRQLMHRSRGGLLLRFTGDLSMTRTWLSRGLARGLVAAIIALGVLGVVAYLNLRLAGTVAGVLLLGTAGLRFFGPRLYRITRKVRRRRSLLTSNIDEQIHTLAVVQISGRSGGEYSRLSRQNDAMTDSQFETARIRAWMHGIASATGWLAIGAVLLVGALELVAGNASVGVIVAAVIACRQLTGPVRRLALSYDYWERAQVSKRKIADFLNSRSQDLDEPGLSELGIQRAAIEFREVQVTDALHGLSGQVPGGHLVALIGREGAGKSTLLQLVAGLHKPDTGQILVDEQPVDEHTLRSRLRRVGMVAPELPLMRGTVRRNLTYRRPNASDEEIQRVVALCHLDELLDQLPDGLQHWIVEGGRNLSAGQRQRLALARALMGNPRILLLDEPTTNLDGRSKQVIRQVVAHHHGTVLMATHDPDEARLADEVWRIEDGRLVEVLTGQQYRDRTEIGVALVGAIPPAPMPVTASAGSAGRASGPGTSGYGSGGPGYGGER
jgi:ATP-binding cassette, subfamily B, bacterial